MTSISGAVVLLAGAMLVSAGLVADAMIVAGKVPASRGDNGLAIIGGEVLAFVGFVAFVAGFLDRRGSGK
jgi:hypothetical protein